MPILERMLEIIIPVFMIVSVGYFYARRYRPDMGVFNRIALEICTPMLTYSALASRTFEIERYLPLPPAVLQFMLADRYQQEPEKVAAMVMLGNVMALIFVPLGLVLGAS